MPLKCQALVPPARRWLVCAGLPAGSRVAARGSGLSCLPACSWHGPQPASHFSFCAPCASGARAQCLPVSSRLQANSEVSALLGRIPSAVGYQPTLATDLGQLQERITSTKKGSITSVQVGAPGIVLDPPAPVAA